MKTALMLMFAAMALAACEAGIYLGPDDDPPSVSLAATASSAAPGDRIGLVAAANDDYRVDEVDFYRVDASGNTLLARDSSDPYSVETSIPSGASGTVQFFARAIDDAGQRRDSALVVITVR
jgi:Bacterial Ig domain